MTLSDAPIASLQPLDSKSHIRKSAFVSAKSDANDRIKSLDGLRAVAILSVMGYHYFSRFPEDRVYPYGDAFANFLPFQFGWMGVSLFFTISGFVIALTLEKCESPLEFAIRRFARLWPALFVASLVTFLVMVYVPSPFSNLNHPVSADFLPTLTFTPGVLWHGLFPNADLIDPVYWTLIVEVRFYILAAILFWTLPRGHLARDLTVIVVVNLAIRAIVKRFSPDLAETYSLIFIPDHLPWFAAGVIFYEYFSKSIRPSVVLLLLLPNYLWIVRASTFDAHSPLLVSIVAIAIFATFWTFCVAPNRLRLMEARWLTRIGLWSYSVYLLHQNIGMVAISSIDSGSPRFVQLAETFVVASAVIFAGYLSYTFIECPAKNRITKLARSRQRTQ
jgi:peptidoglycan/LPS O-acetylase OafA/YrhL